MTDTITPTEARLGALLLSAEELTDLLGRSEAHVWRCHSAGKLPAPVRMGRLTKWCVQEVKAWIEAGCPLRVKWKRPEGGRT